MLLPHLSPAASVCPHLLLTLLCDLLDNDLYAFQDLPLRVACLVLTFICITFTCSLAHLGVDRSNCPSEISARYCVTLAAQAESVWTRNSDQPVTQHEVATNIE